MNRNPNAQVHIDQGNALFTQGKLDQAIFKYRDAIEADPACSEAFNNWGFTLSAIGRLEEAVVQYSNATRINPGFSHAFYNWGNALRRLGRFDEAIARYKRATEIDPKYSLAHNNWGVTLNAQGKLEEAIVQYSKAAETNPNYSQAYNNWGFALDALGRYDEAIAQFSKATSVDPKYADAYDNWGNALSAKGSYVDAIYQFSKVIAINPHNSDAYRNWGLALYFQGRYEEATARYIKSAEYNPHHILTYYYWVVVLTHSGKSSEAAKITITALNLIKQDPQIPQELVSLVNTELAKTRNKINTARSEPERRYLHDTMSLMMKTLDLFLQRPLVQPPQLQPQPQPQPQPVQPVEKQQEKTVPSLIVKPAPIITEPVKPDSPKESNTLQAEMLSAASTLANSPKGGSPKEGSPQSGSPQSGSPKDASPEGKLSNSSFLSSSSANIAITGSPRSTGSPKELSPQGSPKEERIEQEEEEKTLFQEPQVEEYFNFLCDELNTLFKKSFTANEGKLEEKYEMLVGCIHRLAEVIPPLTTIPNADKVFPFVSKISPDSLKIDEIIQIKRVNKSYKRFISHFTSLEEAEKIVEKLAYEAAMLRREEILANKDKEIDRKTIDFVHRGKLLSRSQVSNKAEEYALLDFGMLGVLCFLEGIKVGSYSNSEEKVEIIAKGLAMKMKVYVEN